MSGNYATVKFIRSFVGQARREAGLFHRSLAGQIEHWATLGRAVENAQAVSIEHVRKSLAGDVSLEAFSGFEEQQPERLWGLFRLDG